MEFSEHSVIDAQHWPRVARVPEGILLQKRARLAEKSFLRGCSRFGVSVDEPGTAAMHIHDDAFYMRLAESDWLGFSESYLAAEWSSNDLPKVLARLLDAGLDTGPEGSFVRNFRVLSRSRPALETTDDGGELPSSLLELYAGPLYTAGSALFSSAVRTTAREQIDNQAKGAGRGGIPAQWPVDITFVDPPQDVSRADMVSAQVNRINHLLDMGRVQAGDRVLEWPSTVGEIALRAADRGAGADIATVSDDHYDTAMRRVTEAGLSGPVRVNRISSDLASPREFDSDFEAIINVERMETFSRSAMIRWLHTAERLLVDRGTIVLQMALATDKFDESADRSVDFLRSYIWPQAHYMRIEDFRKLVDRETGLRIAAEEYIPGHFSKTLELQRALFSGNSRQAAALGYDRVFRRLWDYNLGLQQALVDSGRITMVQMELIHKPRRGR